MKYRPRICYIEEQKALMWDRWQKGESPGSIARLFDRGPSSIQRILAESGGIRPARRRRSSRSLSLAEQEEISRGLASFRSLRAIALQLGRAPSTISREVTGHSSGRSEGLQFLPTGLYIQSNLGMPVLDGKY